MAQERVQAIDLLSAVVGLPLIAYSALAAARPQSTESEAASAPLSERYVDGKRKWTPRDSVLTRYFLAAQQQESGSGWSLLHYGTNPEVANISPKGNFFAIESTHGDPECLCNVRELLVYAVDDVTRAIKKGLPLSKPTYVVSVKEDEVPGIRSVKWSADESELLFVRAIADAAEEQGVRLDLRTGQTQVITPPTATGGIIALEKRGPGLVYTVYDYKTKSQRYYGVYSGRLFAMDPRLQFRPGLSPNGRFAVSAFNSRNNGEYYLIDLGQQQQRPLGLTRGSEKFGYYPGWSPDGRKVLLANVVSSSRSDVRNAIISHDVETGENQILARLVDPSSGTRASEMALLGDGHRLQIDFDARDGTHFAAFYDYRDARWVREEAIGSERLVGYVPANAALAGSLKVEVEQSPSQLPMAVAKLGTKRIRLSQPDAALADVWIAPTKPFDWVDAEGTSHVSGLILPRNLPRDGRRIPLVIQIEAPNLKEFRPDGDISTALAAQALAARGIAVLNIAGRDDVVYGDQATSTRFPRLFVNWVDTVIAALQTQYPIDPARVGLVGWSYTGFIARYAATFPGEIRPAAVIVSDSMPQDYVSYLSNIGSVMDAEASRSIGWHHGGEFYLRNMRKSRGLARSAFPTVLPMGSFWFPAVHSI